MLNDESTPLEERVAARLAGFPGFLRANGFGTGGGDAVPVLQTARQVGVLDASLLRWSLKALLCGRLDEWRRFDDLFDAWFLPPNRWQRPEARSRGAVHGSAAGEGEADALDGDNDDDAVRPDASQRQRTGSADFATLLSRESMIDIEALMRRFARRLKPLPLRRHARSPRGRRIDLPTTIRRSVASGGTPFELAWKDRRRVQPRLVLLIDVSRSMAPYSFFYLRLARALAAVRADVHSFVFHTRLAAVSPALDDADPFRAQERLHLIAQGWGGGTRIGESLAQFVREHARIVHARTSVLIFSDGYDTGEPALLAGALAALSRRARRIVWLNPLAQRPGYAPVCQGMQAALPHVDAFVPAGSLAALHAALPALVDALR
jgi:uncharacterized protein with von Willebrand factor type A (vWA) domain